MNEQLIVQIPNALGLLAVYVLGRKHRWGWIISFVSEIAWAFWAVSSDNLGVLPWCALWSIVFARNWWLWRVAPEKSGVSH